jgi:hypothetical protein
LQRLDLTLEPRRGGPVQYACLCGRPSVIS